MTGAGRGQGAAFARRLATDGATTVALDPAPEPAEELPGVAYRQHDVTDAQAWKALASELEAEHGRVDGLVSNAGITWRARVTDLEPADLARLHDVNVAGTLLGIQAPAPLMTGGGSIVVIGSVAGMETPIGRLGTVEDIVPLVAFLLSDDAAYITGAEIPVDGGMSAHGGVKSISDALKEAP